MTALFLTLPPSVNHCWSNVPGRGRVKTAAYREWLNVAGWEIKAQAPGARIIDGPYRLTIEVCAPRYDIDNVVKPCGDLLQTMGLVRNDSLMAELRVVRVSGTRGVRLRLEAIECLDGPDEMVLAA